MAIRLRNYDGSVLTSTKNKSRYCNSERLVVDVYFKRIEIGVGVSFGFLGFILIIVFLYGHAIRSPVMKCSYRIRNPFELLLYMRNGFLRSVISFLSVLVGEDMVPDPFKTVISALFPLK